tara:strand:+ start:149 stop:529 length:381 start_codon:yes stop_codon:yes gene_type:complete
MIIHSVKVLPLQEKDIKISAVFVDKASTGFNPVKKFIKIAKQDILLIKIMLLDMNTMQNVLMDYPNLYLETAFYEEETQDYTRKFLKFKKDSIIIKTKMFKSENIKMKILVKDQGKVIDYCLIDIV